MGEPKTRKWLEHGTLWVLLKERPQLEVKWSLLSCVRLFVTSWTVAHQAPLSMGFHRQEYQSGLPLPTLGDLPDPGIELVSLTFPVLAGRFLPAAPPGKQRRDKQCSNGRWKILMWDYVRFIPVVSSHQKGKVYAWRSHIDKKNAPAIGNLVAHI